LSAEARNILTSCRFFSQVRGNSLDRLLSMARVKRYARRTVIFRQGEPCPGAFILGAGLVRIFQTAPSGKEHVLHLVEPGHTFAEVAAIGGFPCPAHAAAIRDSTCVLLPTGSFAQALREDHTLCLQIMSSMAFWVRHLVGLMEDIVLRDAAGRLARHLLEACGSERDLFVLRSLKKDLASHLNLTSETLSRTLRRLVDAGLIEQRTGGRLRIVRREELKRLADGLFPLV
jgi:CRP-like cAMP-binding protein